MEHGTHCPIAFGLNHFGDRWSLLIIRDLLFKGKRQYREFLESGEGIATAVLADRLKKLEATGVITATAGVGRGNPRYYALTPRGKDLLPVMLEMILWSAKHDPGTEAPSSFVKKTRKAIASQGREAYFAELLKGLP